MSANTHRLLYISVFLVLSICTWSWVDEGRQKGRLKDQIKDASIASDMLPTQRLHYPVNRHGLFSPVGVSDATNSRNGYTLALNIEAEYLFDEKLGLLAKERKQEHLRTRLKGRRWEYPASVILYKDGEVVSDGIVGLRTHGEVKLATKESFHYENCGNIGGRDFRLYNRSGVRRVNFPDDLFSVMIKRAPKVLVVRQKKAVRNYIAYKIAERIGAEIPAIGLVQFEINGKLPCTALISEHISARQFSSDIKYGGVFHRFKDPVGGTKQYPQLSVWLKTKPVFDEIALKVDIENFTAHIFSILYLGNRDWVQGAAIKPLVDGKWKWVLWDLDTTFRKSEYESPAIPLFSRRKNTRAMLFNRLIETSQYQLYFRQFIVDRLNHRLSPDDIDKIFSEMVLYHENDMKEAKSIRLAIKDRGRGLLKDLNQHIGQQQEIVHVNLKSPHDISYSIDGYSRFDSGYVGTYFSGQTLKLGTKSSNFLAWNVNGTSRYVRELEVKLSENLTIFVEVQKN